MSEQIKGLVQHRNKTYAEYAAENKVLFAGEIAIEADSGLSKYGDGVTPYLTLPYSNKELVTEYVAKQTKCGVIIPAYVYPADIYNNVEYKALVDLIKSNEDVPFIVILNANSGPGTFLDTNYAGAIELLKGAGATVIGYIYTLYGTRDLADCIADLDMWKELYPSIEGMFFDEMTNISTPEVLEFYTAINRHAKGLGQRVTVGNPGTLFDKDFIDTSAADIIVGWETGNYPTQEQAEDYNAGGACEYPKTRRALLIHSQGSWSETSFQFCADYFGWLYITDDLHVPNPWDTFSSYMQDMVDGIKYRSLSAAVKALI